MLDTGKPLAEAEADVSGADAMHFYAGHASTSCVSGSHIPLGRAGGRCVCVCGWVGGWVWVWVWVCVWVCGGVCVCAHTHTHTHKDMYKPQVSATRGEIDVFFVLSFFIIFFYFFLGFGYTRREPWGVCAGIGAWNYPLQVSLDTRVGLV